MQARLTVCNGRHKGKKIPLPSSLFLIGRDVRCHLRPSSELVSRLHCVIGPAPGGLLSVRDMRSSNGTFVNGRRIKWTARLRDGDRLQVGTLCFRVEVPEGGVPVTAYRIDHRKADWLFGEEGQPKISPGDTALIQSDESNGGAATERGETKGENVTLKAGGLLRDLLPKGAKLPPQRPDSASDEKGRKETG